jgi:hypothetical protein
MIHNRSEFLLVAIDPCLMNFPNPGHLFDTAFYNSCPLVGNFSIFHNVLFGDLFHELEIARFDDRKI